MMSSKQKKIPIEWYIKKLELSNYFLSLELNFSFHQTSPYSIRFFSRTDLPLSHFLVCNRYTYLHRTIRCHHHYHLSRIFLYSAFLFLQFHNLVVCSHPSAWYVQTTQTVDHSYDGLSVYTQRLGLASRRKQSSKKIKEKRHIHNIIHNCRDLLSSKH